MAKRMITQLISDLSGKEIKDGNGETVKFSIGSATYELDLTSSEAGKFYEDLKKYTNKATKISGRNPRTGSRGKGHSDREQLQAAREWLRANGYDVSDRGRIKQDLMDLYASAH